MPESADVVHHNAADSTGPATGAGGTPPIAPPTPCPRTPVGGCIGLLSPHNDVVRLLRRLVTAIMLGVGAIFGRKNEDEAHWSDPPNWIADADTDDAKSGDT